MPKEIEGQLNAEGLRIGLVVGRFNHFITDQLVAGAIDGLTRHGAKEDNITIVRVPGSFELPAMARRLARSGNVDAVIGISSLIRGATTHYDHIAAEVTKGLATLAMEGDVPVIYGVVTAETIEQAVERAGTKAGNRGFQAAMAAIEMVSLYRQI
ncbi:6,7-dimethyl-8-ribityllumazine synthase [bacterium]|nr:6,7-dimethyl-8-ribityllumazine synthase [bacterium]